jgi:SulP family sulfate permease
LILLFLGKWAALIPMATLAGILVIVAYNMSEWRHFLSIAKGPRSDMAILITTFLLTVLVDLTVAIEIGMILAAFLFMRNMIKSSGISSILRDDEDKSNGDDAESLEHFTVPKGVEVFEITGPLFFGAAYKFKDAMRFIERPPAVLIIRMRKVPLIDATGIKIIKEVCKESSQMGTKLILSEVHSEQILEELKKARVLFLIGKANVTDTFQGAMDRSKVLLSEFA